MLGDLYFPLDSAAAWADLARMDSCKFPFLSCSIVAFLLAGHAAVTAAAPFDSATVTRVENRATVAEIKDGQATGSHPAAVSDAIRANNILQTASNARAELEFKDKSLVRIGPNSVFSFEAHSRTLSLEKGDMLFYLPPGKSGVKLKTAALTAAINGTVVLLSPAGILCLEGSFTLKYMEDGVEKSVTIEAGTDHNAAKFEGGKLVVYKSDGTDSLFAGSRRKLLAWASLPADAERKIAQASPWVKQALADNAAVGLEEFVNVGSFVPVVPFFGGGSGGTGGSGGAVTVVLPSGLVGFFDSIGTFLGLQ